MQKICPVFHLLEEQEPVWTWMCFPREDMWLNYRGGNIICNLCAGYIYLLKAVKVSIWWSCSTDRQIYILKGFKTFILFLEAFSLLFAGSYLIHQLYAVTLEQLMYFLLGITHLGAFLLVIVSLSQGFLIFLWCCPGIQDYDKLNRFFKIKLVLKKFTCTWKICSSTRVNLPVLLCVLLSLALT